MFQMKPVALMLLAAVALAADYPNAKESDFVIHGFRFNSGETLPDLRLHYRTLGTLSGNNAVMILHGTGGSGKPFLSEQFGGVLFGPGQLLDATKYYIILPDGLGHGGSSKPSDGINKQFPHYGYDDMVTAHYRLLTEGLGVKHLRLVMGTSMGAMHTWMWGERYPQFMDGLVPLASIPTQIAGRNRMMREIVSKAIRDDPEWNNGEYTKPPRGLMTGLTILWIMTSSPLTQQRDAPTRDSANAIIDRYMDQRMRTTDANDFLYQYEASRDYDPSVALEKIQAPLVAINSADDVVNPPELGLMERLMPRVKRGKYILIPTSDRTRGHGTHSLPAIWKPYLIDLLKEIQHN